jgi:D-arabinose 1-dehydrogenase-like Zn-dependent alcohol dehydrogenase
MAPQRYRAMAPAGAAHHRLRPVERDTPAPGAGELLLPVHTCGVCRTDPHFVDAELQPRGLPRVPCHEAVGKVVAFGANSAWPPTGTASPPGCAAGRPTPTLSGANKT